ncbi:MAG: bifunctional DNA-formamidopyrimidine glycosylase/DNA-(apurinic or apyrimidinic site) lyase [Phycisphaeraceae bacterium]
MPELPEVETVRRGLAAALPGREVSEVIRGPFDVARSPDPRANPRLLAGDRIAQVLRHGKQLALVGHTGETLCIHLGMSGSLRLTDASEPVEPHTHFRWRITPAAPEPRVDRELRFRDPRRFGGVWQYDSPGDLEAQRWSRLGPDALQIGPAKLERRLAGRTLALKAALLDQHTLAGLGNIYVDELLYACRLHPLRPAGSLRREEVESLVRRMRSLLRRAIEAGGSTLRDYVGADGEAGGFQLSHRAYGREGDRCRRRGCRESIHRTVVAARSTFTCPACQNDDATSPHRPAPGAREHIHPFSHPSRS